VLGLTDVSTGTGFSSVTALLPCLVVSAALVAVTVIIFGVGRFAGAVYTPVASIVPVAVFPPTTVFTDHVTLVFAFPVTAAVNACVAPERTMEVAGATVTVIPALVGGVVGVVGDGAPLLLTVPVQPAASHTSITIGAIQMRFTACPPALTRSSTCGKQGTTIDTTCESRRWQMLQADWFLNWAKRE
jgi:hypothetical protein